MDDRSAESCFFNLEGIFPFLNSLVYDPKARVRKGDSVVTIERGAFRKLETKRPRGIWTKMRPVENWECPLTLSVERDGTLAQALNLPSLTDDYPLGNVSWERGRIPEDEDGDEDNGYERLNLNFVRALPLVNGGSLPRKAFVRVEVQSCEGEDFCDFYSIERRDSGSHFGLIWTPRDFSRELPTDKFLYSEVFNTSNLASKFASTSAK